MNENGQRLLELCCHYGLCITNSYFKCKELHKVSWRHPWCRHWHQLDLTITTRAGVSSALHTRSYDSADCDTDHSLVASKVRLKIHHGMTKGRTRINTCGTSDPVRAQSIAVRLKENFAEQPTTSNPDAKWSHLREAIYDSAMAAFGKKERKNADWFEACWKECSQSRRPRGKRCWLTSRTLPQAHATPFKQLGARPSRPPATVPTSTGRTYAPCERQNSPRSNQRLAMSSLIRACSCSVGWSIISSSTQPSAEHRHRHCPHFPVWDANHRGAWQHADTGRAPHSHRRSRLWQGAGEGRYPAGSFEAWEANHPATASWAPLPVLGEMRDNRHERCQHSHPVQEQGWP